MDNFTKLPNETFSKALKEVIEENLHESADKFDTECSAGSSKGDNYMGVIYKVVVKSKVDKSEMLNLILKIAPENEARREMCNSNMVFNREIDFYMELNETYKKFQESKGINVENDGFYHVCKCYKGLKEEPCEALFLENLKTHGFDMNDRFKDLTREHLILIMKALGKFHAICFAIKDQNPQLIEQKWYDMKDVFLANDDSKKGFNEWYENCKQQCRNVVKGSLSDEMMEKLENFFKLNMFEVFTFLCSWKNADPYAVLNHGDCWNNNILFRNDENGVPTEIRLLDFQIMRYASPVLDLCYCIFSCTTKELRDKCYFEFLDVYHETLSEHILRLGSDPEKLFPRSAFDEQMKKFGKFGLATGLFLIPVVTSAAEDAMDLDEISEKMKEKNSGSDVSFEENLDFEKKGNSKLLQKRMIGVVEDMCNFGYI